MKQNCARCGKPFEANYAGRKHCSAACRWPTIRLQDRFLANLRIEPNGCWVWTAWKDKDGYGSFSIWDAEKKKTKFTRVNRAVFELFHGPIKRGWMVCHHCDNPACFRPSHLFLGTAWDNNHDMISKGRSRPARGEQKSQSKLTESDVKDIRGKYASRRYTQRELAKEYGVGYKAICKIVHRQRWAHV